MNRFSIKSLAVLTALTAAALCGCNKSAKIDTSSSSLSETGTETSTVGDKKVEIKSYEFPDFLKKHPKPDVLSKVVYKSFNKDTFVTDMTAEQMKNFSGYDCDKSINDRFFTFIDNGYTGILDPAGNEIITANKYAAVEVLSANLLALKYTDGSADYAMLTDNGGFVMLDDGYSFEKQQLTIAPAEGKDGQQAYILNFSQTNSVKFKDSPLWDSITEVSKDDIDTKVKFEKCYKATRSGEVYYICFDKYCNYTVYSGEYAHILIKVGDQSGECYVLSSEDYSELNSLVDNFGKPSFADAPSSDQSADYIQITFGLNTSDKKIMTVSPDGYSFTESLNDDKTKNKYFACLDKESFVSLVEWVSKTLAP